MSLRIAQFATRCRISPRRQSAAQIIDDLARHRLPREIAFHLGPSLARQPAIIRIRRLPLSFSIPASNLQEDALAQAWVHSFGKALFSALAYPSGSGPIEMLRADSLADFVACVIQDLLEGDTSRRWAYSEFAEFLDLGNVEGSLALLCQWPHETLAVLLALERRGAFEKLLARLDERSLERLIFALSDTEGASRSLPAKQEGSTAIQQLLAAAALIAQNPPRSILALKSRRYALRLFVQSGAGCGQSQSPRALLHTLQAFSYLVEQPNILDFPELGIDAGDLPSNAGLFLRNIQAEVQKARHSAVVYRLLQSLAELRRELRADIAVPPTSVRRVASDWCGIFFLCETLDRLGWVPAWQGLPQFQSGGISCLLAGLALASTGHFEAEFNALDPGIALFSGYANDPDLAHCRQFFSSASPDARREVLRAVLGNEPSAAGTVDWPAILETLAGRLLKEFASRIRGFRQASRRSIVNNFLQRPGRITVTEGKVAIALEPSAFHVALHISGIDGPLDCVPWLGRRRLEFDAGEL